LHNPTKNDQAVQRSSGNQKTGLFMVALFLASTFAVFSAKRADAQQPSDASPTSEKKQINVPPAEPGLFSIPNSKPTDRTPVSAKPIPATVLSANSSWAFQRESRRILNAARPITRKYQSSVMAISCDNSPCAFGTVVSKGGLVVTKKSLLTRNIICAIGDRSWKARIIASDLQKDLALLQLELESRSDREFFEPISFPYQNEFGTGKIVIGIGNSETPISLGMTTIKPQDINAAGDECTDCIDMGLTLAPFAQPIDYLDQFGNPTMQSSFGLKVLRVYPRTVSERLGILVGDKIQLVNKVQMQHRADFNAVTSNIKAGEPITMVIARNGQEVVIVDEVPLISKKIVQDRWGGGPFSQRRFGFGTVIIHDSVLKPEECGSPLVNLRGQFIGVNIARSMRVASMSIPANQVLAFVRQHQPMAKLSYEQQTGESFGDNRPSLSKQLGTLAN
jgi:S1-C subfamily serine protease